MKVRDLVRLVETVGGTTNDGQSSAHKHASKPNVVTIPGLTCPQAH